MNLCRFCGKGTGYCKCGYASAHIFWYVGLCMLFIFLALLAGVRFGQH